MNPSLPTSPPCAQEEGGLSRTDQGSGDHSQSMSHDWGHSNTNTNPVPLWNPAPNVPDSTPRALAMRGGHNLGDNDPMLQ